jgi:hypothetical protein
MSGLSQSISGMFGAGTPAVNQGASMFGPVSPATTSTVNNMASMGPMAGSASPLNPSAGAPSSSMDPVEAQILADIQKQNQTNPWTAGLIGAQGPADTILEAALQPKKPVGMTVVIRRAAVRWDRSKSPPGLRRHHRFLRQRCSKR